VIGRPNSLTLLAPRTEGAERGAGATLLACPLAGLSAPGACYAAVRGRAVRTDAVPPNRPPPASCRNHSLLADPAGRVSSKHPPRRPTASAAPASNGLTERELQRPSAATGAGRPMATTTSSLPQHPYRICYYRSVGGIFLTEGFQTTIRLPEVPPHPLEGLARFSPPGDRGKRKGPPSPRPCPPAAVGTHRVVNHDRRPRVARQPVNERSRPSSLDLVWKDDSSRVP
jgi:hypothetical protein